MPNKPYDVIPLDLGFSGNIWGRNFLRAFASYKEFKSTTSRYSKVEVLSYFCLQVAKVICNSLNIPLAFISFFAAMAIFSHDEPGTVGLAITFIVFGFLLTYVARKPLASLIFKRVSKSKRFQI
jgi:hypothetical protein